MEAYKRWVRRNRDYVRQLSSLASGMTWLLPERFAASEIGPEAVSSILGMVTTVNEHIIDTAPTSAHTSSAETSFLPLSLCLTLLRDLETLIEVVAEQLYGEDKKWNLIALTEAAKVCVRLAVFRGKGYKMLLQGGETENLEDSDDLSPQESMGQLRKPIQNQGLGPNHLQGRAMSALSSFGQNARTVSEPTWLRRVQQQQAILEPPAKVIRNPSLSTFLSEKGIRGGLFVTGEAMFVLRPLIYVLLVRKYGTRSWFPWFISLSVDLIGNSILSVITTSQDSGKDQHFQFSKSEKDELKRRKLLWVLYLMRDPFFSKYTRRRLESTQKIVEPVPVVGFFAEKLIELLIGAQTRYTYMSGS
ncbi:peroxisome biogenesis protein 16 isoform X1 [Lycium barbarum]|uniref:peroxisome biogenesis protein 16 isoform X1 n=3 Tax=Lycium barbarum TaxID=112863 RepID=UPI00293F6335|nr:peroxisome biogenesis protein 16 isoform X1 [Lycium barbarum]